MLSTEKLEELSSEQRQKLEQIGAKWRQTGLGVGATDRATAEFGLTKAYGMAGMNVPRIKIWLSSPRAGFTAERILRSNVEWPYDLTEAQRVVWTDVYKQCMRQIEAVIGIDEWALVRKTIRQETDELCIKKYGRFIERTAKEIFAEKMGIWVWRYLRQCSGMSVIHRLKDKLEEKVKARLDKVISFNVHNEIFKELVPTLRRQVWSSLGEPIKLAMSSNNAVLAGPSTWNCGYGTHDASWIAYYDYLSSIGVVGTDLLDGMKILIQSCGWFWPYENLCILTDLPTTLSRDNRGRLHSETQMAIGYPDRWGFYAWNGIIVPDYVLFEPISVDSINAEPNTEVRRVMIERLGLENYLSQGNVIKVHEDKTGTLYRMNLRGDEPIIVVRVTNNSPEPDGTYKNYVLRVPPNMMRARQAVAWTFGLAEEDYTPLAET